MRGARLWLNAWLLVGELCAAAALILLRNDIAPAPPALPSAPTATVESLDVAAAPPIRRRVVSASEDRPPAARRAREAHFFGLVLDAEEGRPIAGARVALFVKAREFHDHQAFVGHRTLCRTTTDARGRFSCAYATPRASGRVETDGFSTALFATDVQATSAQDPYLIRLTRPASLRVTVLNGQGWPLPSMTIELATSTPLDDGQGEIRPDLGTVFIDTGPSTSTTSSEGQDRARPQLGSLEWQHDTDGHGQCVFDGLPAGVPFTVTLTRNDWPLQEYDGTVTLKPREQHAIDIWCAGGITLHGRMIDQEGRAVAGQGVCLYDVIDRGARAAHDPAAAPPLEYCEASTQGGVRATTDDEGRFAIADLSLGSYHLSPAAGTDVAPIAEIVTIAERPAEIEVRVTRGLFISGHILTPLGRPQRGAQVSASTQRVRGAIVAAGDREGSFRLGPLPDDEFTVRGPGGDPVLARAGATNVVLRTSGGYCLEGTIVDGATGERCEARLTIWQLTRRKDGGRIVREGLFRWHQLAAQDGTFQITSSPGRHGLFAVTRDGRVALTTDIELGTDESPAEIELRVQPGCRLRIRYDGVSRDACYFVQMDGALLAQGTIVPGQAVDEFFPAGQPAVYLLEYRGSFAECLQPGKSGCQSRMTTLSVGDAAQVTFAAAPR